MDEFELIQRYFARRCEDPNVLLGIGDDGAIVRPDAGRELVIVVDTLVEGVHFPAGMDAADIGYRAVAVNLSDIAAMAARPRWMTLALTLERADEAWLEGFAAGLFTAAAEFSLELIGGDTSRGAQTVVSVQITGDVRADKALRRSGAAAGDGIFVTGTPGDAAAGLGLWQSGAGNDEDRQYLVQRFLRPSPRVAFAAGLAAHASAAIDISDGLFGDVGKLLAASEVGGTIELDLLPLSRQLVAVCGKADALQFALDGGDDYEIAFTSAPSRISAIAALVEKSALRVTRIGTVTDGDALHCTQAGHPVTHRHAGYRHFAEESDD